MHGKLGGVFLFKNPKDELHDSTKCTLLQQNVLYCNQNVQLNCTYLVLDEGPRWDFCTHLSISIQSLI